MNFMRNLHNHPGIKDESISADLTLTPTVLIRLVSGGSSLYYFMILIIRVSIAVLFEL